MRYTKQLIDRYKHFRSIRMLKQNYSGKYAFVGIGNHSVNNLYPVIDYLHIPLKYICCKSKSKLALIENTYHSVHATTSLQTILNDKEVKGVFVSVSPQAHFTIASEVLKSGKALFIEKPPCQNMEELMQLVALQNRYNNIVAIDLQKRCSPIVQILKKNLHRCDGTISYNLRFLTGAYPEGNSLNDLFIHPLDCMVYLFGKAKVKYAEKAGNTLMLILEHRNATGMLELSTDNSWNDAKECWSINTNSGIYEQNNFEELIFQSKPKKILGIPLEKIHPQKKVTVSLYNRNNFVPLIQNNQIVTQGYYHTIKNFMDAVEGNIKPKELSFESLVNTYSLIEELHHYLKK